MLQPKRTKHRKTQKGRMKGNTKRGATLAFGTFGLKALDSVWLTSRQIESARQAMTRHMKREGNVWIRVFPDKPITAKPAEVRMGKGKGNPEGWAAIVQPGRIIFEADGVTEQVAKEAMELAAQKLPIVDKSAEKIVKTVRSTGAVVTGPIPLPTHKKIFTVLRSPHVNKKAREQFQLCTHKRLLDIYTSSSRTVDALSKLDLPSGVDVEIKA